MKKRTFFLVIISLFLLYSCEQKKVYKTPMMGWSSWNAFGLRISDSIICKQADLLVEKGLKEAGYNYINIDDGFFGDRDEQGNMTAYKQRFPKGMRVVSDYIHKKGLKAGIYSEAGTATCGAIWSEKKGPGLWAGLYGHDKQDAHTYFNLWNYDFIKIDYCGGQDLNLDEQKRYTEIYKNFKKTTKKPIEINICRWAYPGAWVEDVADSWRISYDITNTWESIQYIINKNKYLSGFARNHKYNDMDMLEIGMGLKPNEEEVHFGLWCLFSSPLLIGCDMNKLDDFSLQLLKNKELIDLNQDPLGKQAYLVYEDKGVMVFVKDILAPHSTTRAFAIYNSQDSVCNIKFPLQLLELGGEVQLRNLVKQTDEEVVRNEIDMRIGPRSVKIYKAVAEQRLEPFLYEAEWAFLPLYNDLEKDKKNINFATDTLASGKMKIINVGCKPENNIVWEDVWSKEGGRYLLTVKYFPMRNSQIHIKVNDQTPIVCKEVVFEGKSPKELTIPILLKKGTNKVSIGSPYCHCPDIDCITLQKQ